MVSLKKTLILSQRVFQHLSRTVATDETVEVKLAFLWFLVSVLCARACGHASSKVLDSVVGLKCV